MLLAKDMGCRKVSTTTELPSFTLVVTAAK